MDHIPEEPASVSGVTRPPERRLTGGRNKVERIAVQSRELFDDVKDWVELKIKLTRLEIEQEIDAKKEEVLVMATVAFIGLLALLFGLTAAALGLGAWLGHSAWGFLVVTVALLLAAGLLWYVRGPGRKGASKEVVVTPKETPPPA